MQWGSNKIEIYDTHLLRAAVLYAKEQGATIVEGYPLAAGTEQVPDAFAYYGLASTFLQAGFTEVARRSATRPIMRYTIQE